MGGEFLEDIAEKRPSKELGAGFDLGYFYPWTDDRLLCKGSDCYYCKCEGMMIFFMMRRINTNTII